MAQNDNDLQVTLPEELRRQFADVQRRLWRVETTVALCSILAGLVASLLALFISDRLWDTPPGLRLVFSLLGLAVVFGALFIFHVPAQLNLTWTILAIVASVLVGVLFGWYPAYRASKLDPIEALRHV